MSAFIHKHSLKEKITITKNLGFLQKNYHKLDWLFSLKAIPQGQRKLKRNEENSFSQFRCCCKVM